MNFDDIQQTLARLFFSSKIRRRVYDKLAAQIAAGVSLDVAIFKLWKNASKHGRNPNDFKAIVLHDWHRQLEGGAKFSDAVARWIPQSEQILIQAGESSTRLPIALAQATTGIEAETAYRRAVTQAVAYPLFLTSIALGFLNEAAFMIIPQTEEVLPADKWTGIPALAASLAHVVQLTSIPVLIAVPMLYALYRYTLPRWTGRIRANIDRYPPWSFYRLRFGGNFLHAVAALNAAGVPLHDIPYRLRQHASPWLRERLDALIQQLGSGYTNLGTALQRTALRFPDDEINEDLETYSDLPIFESKLPELATTWQNDTITRVKDQAAILNKLLTILSGGLIAFLGIALLQIFVLLAATPPV